MVKNLLLVIILFNQHLLPAQMLKPTIASSCLPQSQENFTFSPTFIANKEIHIIQATSAKNPAIYHYWEFDVEGRLFKHFELVGIDTLQLHLWEYSEEENTLLWESYKEKTKQIDVKIGYRYNKNQSLFQQKVYQNPNFRLQDTYYYYYDENKSLPTHIRTQKSQNEQVIKTCDCFYAPNKSQITKEIVWENPSLGITTNYEYDSKTRIKKISQQDDAKAISTTIYQYDDNGNLTQIQSTKMAYKFLYAANSVLKEMTETHNGITDTKIFSYIFYE